MSIFTLIRYPVFSTTSKFAHLPDDIWDAYIQLYQAIPLSERKKEDESNQVLINLILEWEDEHL